jgi:hypothetical protein
LKLYSYLKIYFSNTNDTKVHVHNGKVYPSQTEEKSNNNFVYSVLFYLLLTKNTEFSLNFKHPRQHVEDYYSFQEAQSYTDTAAWHSL